MEIKYFPAPHSRFTLPTVQLISLNPQCFLIKTAAAGMPPLQMCLDSLHTSLAILTTMCQSRRAWKLALAIQKHTCERPWRVSFTQVVCKRVNCSSAALWERWELTTVMICADAAMQYIALVWASGSIWRIQPWKRKVRSAVISWGLIKD